MEYLNIEYNNIIKLPNLIYRIKNLKNIILDGNPIQYLPNGIKSLPKLRNKHTIYTSQYETDTIKINVKNIKYIYVFLKFKYHLHS